MPHFTALKLFRINYELIMNSFISAPGTSRDLVYCFRILRTIVLQKILVYYGKNNKNITQQDALYYGLGFILCTIILTLYTHTYLLHLQEMGLKIRVALCSLIYRKCLSIRSSKISEISSGKTVTLVSKDVREFETVLITLQDASVGIVHIFVFTYLMYSYVGIAALISVGIMVAFMSLQRK